MIEQFIFDTMRVWLFKYGAIINIDNKMVNNSIIELVKIEVSTPL